MNKEELGSFYDKLAELTEHGTEQDVRSYLDHYYPRLPESVRSEVLFSTLLGALKEEAQEEAAVAEVVEKGIGAALTLEKAREEITKNGLTE